MSPTDGGQTRTRGDEPAGTHQPRTHDRRGRKQRPGRRRRCRGLTTPTSSSLPPAAGQRQPTNARCHTATHGQSRSTNHFRRGSPPSRSLPILALQPVGPAHRSRAPSSAATPSDTTRPGPDRQRASDPSLLQRLQAATERIKHLEGENRQLRGGARPRPRSAAHQRRSRRSPRHADNKIRRRHRPPADHASKTPSSTHNRWSTTHAARHQLQITSGLFAANCAWLGCAMIAHNLLRAAGTLAGGNHAVARGATLRRDLVNVPARFAAPARKPMLHLPAHWPWQIRMENPVAQRHRLHSDRPTPRRLTPPTNPGPPRHPGPTQGTSQRGKAGTGQPITHAPPRRTRLQFRATTSTTTRNHPSTDSG